MSRLHIFNPSHDEALAANSPYYYPAKAARMLGTDLGVLPAWWAQEDDWILLPNEVRIPENDFTQHGVRWVHPADLRQAEAQGIESVHPWGWDPLLVHQLSKAGVAEHLLPTSEELERIRQLSSRQTAVGLLQAVRLDVPQTIGTSFWCTQIEEVKELVIQYGNLMLKAPWSSSGRGVFAVGRDFPDNLRSRIVRILKEQGAIEAEPLYPKVADFALEFSAHQDKVVYEGLSVFATTENGAYTGNIIGEETLLLQHLPEEIRQLLPEVTASLCNHLHHTLGTAYEGPLGVDLMSVRQDDGSLALHPCVEINLRRTMGHVALALRTEITPGQTGIYRLQPLAGTYDKTTRRLTPYAQKMEALLLI